MQHTRRKKNLFMSATALCVLFIIAITSSYKGCQWMWKDYPQVGIALLFCVAIFGIMWHHYQKQLTLSPYR